MDGAERVFERMVREHQDRVFALSLAMTGNRHDAEEVAQDTFLRAYRALTEIRPRELAMDAGQGGRRETQTQDHLSHQFPPLDAGHHLRGGNPADPEWVGADWQHHCERSRGCRPLHPIPPLNCPALQSDQFFLYPW